MKKRRIIAGVAGGIVFALVAFAGWQHTQNGPTALIDRATPATYWLRGTDGFLYTSPRPIVDYQTVKEVYATLANVAPVLRESFGFWDTTNALTGMVFVRTDLSMADALSMNANIAGVYDIEWMAQTDGTNWWLIGRP